MTMITSPQLQTSATGLSEWNMMKEQASMLVKTKFLPPAIDTPEKAIAIMMKGRELGMPPMQAFSHINIIQGKPTLSAEGMLAQIFKHHPQTRLKYLKNDDEACAIEVTRPGNEPSQFSFTYEDAKKARLTGKDNWDKYRRSMLRSRCISEMARALFPDALQGCSYTPEEVECFDAVVVQEVSRPVVVKTPPVMVKDTPIFDDKIPAMVDKVKKRLEEHGLQIFEKEVWDLVRGKPWGKEPMDAAIETMSSRKVS